MANTQTATADAFRFVNVGASYDFGVATVMGLVYQAKYGLKKQTNLGKDGNNNAIDATSKAIVVPDKQAYTFTDSTPGGDVTQSENVFKKDPGIAGLVLKSGSNDPVPNVTVQIYDASNKLQATLTTDQDGWYMWQYKYTGKAATFTVKLPAYAQSQTVTLKSNGFATASFTLP